MGREGRNDSHGPHPVGQDEIIEVQFPLLTGAVDELPGVVLMARDRIGDGMLAYVYDIVHGLLLSTL